MFVVLIQSSVHNGHGTFMLHVILLVVVRHHRSINSIGRVQWLVLKTGSGLERQRLKWLHAICWCCSKQDIVLTFTVTAAAADSTAAAAAAAAAGTPMTLLIDFQLCRYSTFF